MTDTDSFPDDVPIADAVEQLRPASEPVEPDIVVGPSDVPLESNESDWQEQLQVVEDPDPDEIRE
ncbi:hypothetical protein ACXDF8_11870 [Mycolicibacterium sp. CBM1]